MGYTFISYSSKDSATKDKFNTLLKQNNIESWIAPNDIPPGCNYAEIINKAIKNCACFILLLTKESVKSQWVTKEIERAVHYNKYIIPIKLEDVTLTDALEFFISSEQIVNLNSSFYSDNLEGLLSTIKEKNATSGFNKKDIKPDKKTTRNNTRTLDFESNTAFPLGTENLFLNMFRPLFDRQYRRKRTVKILIFYLVFVLISIIIGIVISNIHYSNYNLSTYTLEEVATKHKKIIKGGAFCGK